MITHYPTCNGNYPEKPSNELPQYLIVDIEAVPDSVVITCADCGATAIIPLPVDDSVVEANVAMLRSRSRVGMKKYGTNLDRDDLSLEDWFTHIHEELLDAANYVMRAKYKARAMERERDVLKADLERLEGHVFDVIHKGSDDAFYQAEQWLKANAPLLYNEIGIHDGD